MYNYRYPYYPNDESYYRQQQLISDIEKAINGQYSAISCYERLARMAPTMTEREQIQEIRQDEVRHYQQFVAIYANLTGKQPQPKIVEECPNNYLEGLEFALQDEQKTTDFYLNISDEATTPQIKRTFRRAAADEQNHAVWFLYYYVKNR
ncbi:MULTISPECIES: ferritin-like domain-containing protein [Clostridia]|uniref:ferritin-like domain-containing protein n=1 Tax=Clostridia TaxID=186801 RepID=UPI000EA19C5C|nr:MULTISPECIES: ferritin-like domain-containing protein [Clostridia]NBJ69204.1 ferritin-like domain-containing protein [Roseburia sp. 1XD42-34]RKI79176.1 ferritin-like domain-containing protein [Clostridium sp. 1xD42-85]